MRIAFFCPHSDPLAAPGEPDAGGQCLYEAQVSANLATQGHEMRAFTRHWGDKPEQEDIATGARVFRIAMGPEGFLRKEDLGPHLPAFAAELLKAHGAWLAEADVFHGHYWDGGATALMVALALGKPLVFTSHSLGALKRDRLPDEAPDCSQFRYDLRIRAESRILAAADKVIALSGNERDALMVRYGCAPDKIEIVPGGVDVESFSPCADKRALQRQLGFDTDFMLFTAGRLDPRKGFLELLESLDVAAQRVSQTGQTVTFCLPAGPERPNPEERAYRDALVGRARELRIERHIHWFQRLDDDALKTYYRAADLFLCPSHYEPFGLVLVEAFASGTPVVATRHGGPVDIVSPGVDGYLANPLNPEEFGGRIADFLRAPEAQRQAMGKAAHDKAHQRYAWSAVARAIAQVYAGLPEQR
jgi:glycosyltransferase involved in cell wall biosynthesis